MVLFEENVKNLLTDDAKIGTFISARLLSDNELHGAGPLRMLVRQNRTTGANPSPRIRLKH